MGYGKTTAVRDYLQRVKAEYLWFSGGWNKTSTTYIRDTLIQQLVRKEPALATRLKALGFPLGIPPKEQSNPDHYQVRVTTNLVLVIDDYHLAQTPELNQFLEKIVRAEISWLHLVLISRTKPEMNLVELKFKGYCYFINHESFKLSIKEIKKYFKMFGVNISTAVAQRVYRISEGWIAAVYFMIQQYDKNGRLEPDHNIEGLIENVVSHYTPTEIKVLLSICLFDGFTLQQAAYLTEDIATMKIIRRLCVDNPLITYDEQTGLYKMHYLLNNYLRKLLEQGVNGINLSELYRRLGKWYLDGGDLLSGFKFFLKGGAYDLILDEFEKPGITKILSRYPRLLIELFEQIPEEVKYSRPIGYLNYANFYLTHIDLERGAELLTRIEEYYLNNSDVSPKLKKRILGEIKLSKSFLCFNDLRKMHECQMKAYQLLNGSSIVANKGMPYTFGSPHILYLCHREKGEMSRIVDYAVQAINA